jgi:hypothetical protein
MRGIDCREGEHLGWFGKLVARVHGLIQGVLPSDGSYHRYVLRGKKSLLNLLCRRVIWFGCGGCAHSGRGIVF